MSKNSGNTLFALVTGVAVGAVLGVLFAPEEGKETRKKLKKSFGEASENFKNKFDETADNVREKSKHFKKSLEENIDSLLSHSGKKAEEVISVLEKKLASLKKND